MPAFAIARVGAHLGIAKVLARERFGRYRVGVGVMAGARPDAGPDLGPIIDARGLGIAMGIARGLATALIEGLAVGLAVASNGLLLMVPALPLFIVPPLTLPSA